MLQAVTVPPLPSLRDACMGGDTSGTNVSKSKRPVLDWAFRSQYRFSKSIMSDSSTSRKKKQTKKNAIKLCYLENQEDLFASKRYKSQKFLTYFQLLKGKSALKMQLQMEPIVNIA